MGSKHGHTTSVQPLQGCCIHYLSNTEIECSVTMKQAVQDAYERKLENYQQMKSVDWPNK